MADNFLHAPIAGSPQSDRLSAAIAAGRAQLQGIAVSREEAVEESDRLYDEAMRGEFGPWTISRAIDLAAQWQDSEELQVNAGRLIALGSEASAVQLCWRSMLERFPASDVVLAEYVKSLGKTLDEESADALYRAYRPGQTRPSEMEDAGESLAALEKLLERGLRWRESYPPVRTADLGSIVLVGGTLGGGGAERQLVNTALGVAARRSAGTESIGPVSVYCRKLDRRRGHDFYLPRLEAAAIPVADYLRAEPFGGNRETSRLAPLMPLIDKLPHRMREGTVQLTELLRHEAPDVVQIWQDGAIFAAGLAALITNVARIILTVRTMPPTARADRRKPEQATLYRGLLRAPGVSLTANSHMAARAYEEWLGLDEGAVAVIPNGVEPLPVDGDDTERARWEEFDARTKGGFTLGGVMRFDDNKRPLEWLAIAAALAEKLPETRFVLAGAGPLRSAAEDFARRKGISERTLFTGRTPHIGFWLAKMDALALTSRHEGLPNVLIEAQLAGVPVVTTPAGGAAEAVADHLANLVLASPLTVAHEQAAVHLARLAQRSAKQRADDIDALKLWATDQFSIDHMIDRTIEIFAG
ncbi:MAG: glycosyltransferase [Sphingomonadaceae bacterium]|nr:glycosyltransferase [Sphingomonadaceae bacterium]